MSVMNRFYTIFASITHPLRGFGLGTRYPILSKIFSLLNKILKPKCVTINGITLSLNPNDVVMSDLFVSDNNYEELEKELFLASIKNNMIIADIGANIGFFSLLAAKKGKGTNTIYVFEPDKQNFALLQKNIDENKVKNIIALNKAVSDSEEPLTLYLDKNNCGDHRTYRDPNMDRLLSYKVEGLSLDSIFSSSAAPPSVIKMDIQGYEPAALKGMKKLLAKTKDLILFTEFWPEGLKASGLATADEYLSLLSSHDLKSYLIDTLRKRLVQVTTLQDLAHYYDIGQSFHANLICLKGERYENILKEDTLSIDNACALLEKS